MDSTGVHMGSWTNGVHGIFSMYLHGIFSTENISTESMDPYGKNSMDPVGKFSMMVHEPSWKCVQQGPRWKCVQQGPWTHMEKKKVYGPWYGKKNVYGKKKGLLVLADRELSSIIFSPSYKLVLLGSSQGLLDYRVFDIHYCCVDSCRLEASTNNTYNIGCKTALGH